MSIYAIVLAAGIGERMWPLTSTRPKPLLPIPGGTLLSRILKSLERMVKGVVLVVKHYEWMIREYVEKVLGYGGWIRYALQDEVKGTAHAIRVGLKALPRSADKVIIYYGDVYFDPNPLENINLEDDGNIVVASHVEDSSSYGLLVVRDGVLEKIIEKPEKPIPGLVNTGLMVLDRQVLEEAVEVVKLSPRGEYEATDALTYIAKKTRVNVVAYNGFWRDVGTPWSLLEVVRHELSKLKTQQIEGEVETGAKIIGPVYIAPTAVVRAGSVIEGPSWIEGEVGPLSHIRPYTLTLLESKVGALTQVKASIIMEYAKVPHLNYVGDSIVGEASNLGAGTITANLRFDHNTIKIRIRGRIVDTKHRKLGAFIGGYAQTGINVSLMPGVRVGAFSWIAPGLTVYDDVPDCTFLHISRRGALETTSLRDKISCRVSNPPWRIK